MEVLGKLLALLLLPFSYEVYVAYVRGSGILGMPSAAWLELCLCEVL